VSRTYRRMAYSPEPHYDGYQDRWYHTQVMDRETVRKLYRDYLAGHIKELDHLLLVTRDRWELDPTTLAKAAHRTVFRNRCSYRQRITAIRLAKKARRKTERAIAKQKLYRDAEGFSMSRKDCK